MKILDDDFGWILGGFWWILSGFGLVVVRVWVWVW